MKVLLLAGGLGTRLSEETIVKPKPMVELGGKPILWHIMKIYSKYGFNDFVILLGYKGYLIKEYFANYLLYQSDVTVDMSNGEIEVHNNSSEQWKVTLIDTGLDSMTGGRIKRARDLVGNNAFMLTYGDGVANINIKKLLKFHQTHGKSLTITSARPEGRFGALEIDSNDKVLQFKEKPQNHGGWINAGFFVCEPKVFDYITEGDKTVFENNPLINLAADNEAYTYKHTGFWLPMDTMRDKIKLNQMCENGEAPWITWDK